MAARARSTVEADCEELAMTTFDTRVSDPWSVDDDFPDRAPAADKLEFLLRYAVLAPSSHNTQPWRFRAEGARLMLLADRARWLRVADADQRELHVSLGCALENLRVAARHFGEELEVEPLPEPGGDGSVAILGLAPEAGGHPHAAEHGLFEAIRDRRTNRRVYRDQPLAPEDFLHLCDAGVPGACVFLTSDGAIRRRVDELSVRADVVQFADPAWREELGRWMSAGAFEMPWLVARMAKLAVTWLDLGRGTARRDVDLLDGAPAVGAVATPGTDGLAARLEAGGVFEHLWLRAATLGLALQPMNQILQVAELKREVAGLLPEGSGTPQVVFRVGHAEAVDSTTPRRPVPDVLV
jgi:hypothetical protein